jgi:hypothetical protein
MNTQNNEPAFPTSFNKDYPTEIVGGMTLRDYFAARIVAATFDQVTRYDQMELVAKNAYLMADVMLEARK